MIREKALGGPDTATRLKTIWQVKVLSVTVSRFDAREFSKDITTLSTAFRMIGEKLQPQMRRQLAGIKKSARKLVASRAAALEWLPTVEEARKLLDDVASMRLPPSLSSAVSAIVEPIRANLPPAEHISCKTPFPEWTRLITPPTGQLNARTSPAPPDDDPCCTIPPGAGYRGLENQLYRVEVHQGNVQPDGAPIQGAEPTFKWSRDNGSVVTAITGIDGSTISVHDIGPDNVLGFSVGQWVEVIDDTRELNRQPGDLVQITDMPPNSRQIVVKGALTVGFNNGIYHPKLRRWDSPGAIAIPTSNAGWISLEAGIEVKFPVKDGTYKTGDYWLIPARTANSETVNDIEWLRDANSQPIAQSPRGIRHHYCRLALVALTQGMPDGGVAGPVRIDDESIQDCRCIFPPLCKLKPEHVTPPSPAIHIDKVWFINESSESLLPNGASIELGRLQQGLAITCDHPIDASTISQPTCFLTLDLPFPLLKIPLGSTDQIFWTTVFAGVPGMLPIMGFQPVILDGEPILDPGNPSNIWWRPKSDTTGRFLTSNGLKEQLRVDRILAHLTLKGRFIWAQDDPTMYLDGEAFGAPDGQLPNNLRLRSGDRRRGSDFEMWFWLTLQ